MVPEMQPAQNLSIAGLSPTPTATIQSSLAAESTPLHVGAGGFLSVSIAEPV